MRKSKTLLQKENNPLEKNDLWKLIVSPLESCWPMNEVEIKILEAEVAEGSTAGTLDILG